MNLLLGMIFILCLKVGSASQFWRRECSERNSFAGNHYGCSKSFVITTNANYSDGAVFTRLPSIVLIGGFSYLSKIVNPVVFFIAVDVVNIGFRKFTKHITPSKAMGVIMDSINSYFYIPLMVKTSLGPYSRGVSTTPNFPSKNSSLSVVRKKCLELLGKIIGSRHCSTSALMMRAGTSLEAVYRLDHFTLMGDKNVA